MHAKILRFAGLSGALASVLLANSAQAGQASGPEPEPDAPGLAAGTAQMRYQRCRSETPTDPDLAEYCAELAIGSAEDRLPEAYDGNEMFAGALGALGELALTALSSDQSPESARITANDAAAALALARADLLLDQDQAPPEPLPLAASFEAMSANPAVAPGNLANARRLWVASRVASCAAYPVRVCNARYDAMLRVFIDRAGFGGARLP